MDVSITVSLCLIHVNLYQFYQMHNDLYQYIYNLYQFYQMHKDLYQYIYNLYQFYQMHKDSSKKINNIHTSNCYASTRPDWQEALRSQPLRSSVTQLWTRYFENKLTDFDANWQNWSTGGGNQEVKGEGHMRPNSCRSGRGITFNHLWSSNFSSYLLQLHCR